MDRALDIHVSVDWATSTGLFNARPVRRWASAIGIITTSATMLSTMPISDSPALSWVTRSRMDSNAT